MLQDENAQSIAEASDRLSLIKIKGMYRTDIGVIKICMNPTNSM